MAVSDNFLAYVLDQLDGLGDVHFRRMFGGVGLYCGERFFGLLDDNALYFKVDDLSRGNYLARGMGAFCPFPDRPEHTMSYYQVPADVIEDAEMLVVWARDAVRVAAAAPLKKKPVKARQSKRRVRR